jgi:gliding motility-associated-like protein
MILLDTTLRRFKKYVFSFFTLLLFICFNTSSYACDKTSTTVNSVVNNGNGTYTVTFTSCMEPGDATGCTSSLKIQFNAAAKILSTNKNTLTYLNGTVHTAGAITGNSNILTWSGASLCSTAAPSKNECFTISVVVNSNPTTFSTENGHGGCSHTANFPTVTNLTCTSSGGTFSDGGGNYGNDLNQTTIICPDNPGEKVQVNFTSPIDSKGSFGSCVVSGDNLYIYQGNSVGSGLVGMYCQNNSAPGLITSTDPSGCLTFQFITNSSGVATGFSTSVTCLCTTPVLSIHNPAAVCSPSTVDITAPAVTAGSTGGGTLTYWTDAACTIPLGSPSAITTTGIYYIKAANGSCKDSKAVNVTVNGPATPTATLTQPTCATPTGTITLTAPLGAFTYNNNGGAFQAGTAFSGLAPNTTYTIIAKDAGGCTSTANFTINATPSAPSTPTATLTHPTCAIPTGTITLTAPLGAYTYNINVGAFQAGAAFSGLAPNTTFTIIAKDAGGCSSTANFTINAIPSGPAAPTTTLTQPTCLLGTGTILITAPTGAGYTYSIDGIAFQGTTTFSGLAANTYTITVKDAGGCSSTGSVTLNNPPGAPSAATTTLTQPTCAVTTGTISVTAPLGAFTYSIDGVAFQAGTSFSGLAPANYTVTVKDAGGCTSTTNVTINAVPSAPSAPTFTLTQPTCLVNTGTITITAPLGAFTYSIDGVAFQAGTAFSGLAANTYTVTVKDAGGCTATSNATLNNPAGAPSAATTTLTQPTCLLNTGTITITAPLGAYTYSIDGVAFQAGTAFSGLAPNTYTVSVKDGLGCTSTSNVTITAAPGAPAIPTLVVTDPICGGTTGSITVSAPLGVFTYSSDGVAFQAGTTFSGLAPNNYTITVKNASGCTSTNTATILAAPLTPAIETSTLTQPTCLVNTGTISITSPLGAYTYSIDGVTFQAGLVFSGLAPNTYTITVKNASNCTSTNTETILPVPAGPANPTATLQHPTCLTPTGSLTVTAPIGTYTYSIDGTTFQANTLFSGLASGNYTVTAKDAIGCTSTSNFTLNPLPANPINPTLTVTQPTCQITTGTIFITAPLGAYTYSKDGVTFQAGTFFNALAANATFTITVKDAGGCTSSAQATVNPQLVIPSNPTATITHASCTSATGSFNVTTPIAAGNVYSIDGITYQLGTSFTGLAPNGYTLTVKNSDGCTASSLITINVPPNPPAAPFVLPKHPNCTVKTGEISIISPLGAGFTYSLDNILFQSGVIIDSLATGNYIVYVKDANNCVSNSAFTINAQPILPKASFSYTPTELNILNTVVNFTNNSSNATTYKWSFDDGSKINTALNPVHEFPGTPNIYFVKLTASNNNCSDDTIVPITIVETPIIYVPNSFTPNGDEVNNTFSPVIAGGIANENYSLYIFNRWGDLIFESHNKDFGWDGSFGNKMCMPDTYIWKIEYRENSGNKLKKYMVGHVNLIN